MFALLALGSIGFLAANSDLRNRVATRLYQLTSNVPSAMATDKLANLHKIYKNTTWETLKSLLIVQLRSLVSARLETGLVHALADHYDLTYYDGISKYIVRFPRIRGPGQISQILSSSADVTDHIRQYLGPSHNFHGIPTRPALLGYKSLTFVFLDESSATFAENEIIVLSKRDSS